MPLFGSGGDHSAQLSRIEKKLDQVLAAMAQWRPAMGGNAGGGSGGDDPRMAEVRALAAGGRKIEAIKIYREITGLGLKEAKDAVDAM